MLVSVFFHELKIEREDRTNLIDQSDCISSRSNPTGNLPYQNEGGATLKVGASDQI